MRVSQLHSSRRKRAERYRNGLCTHCGKTNENHPMSMSCKKCLRRLVELRKKRPKKKVYKKVVK